MVSYFRDVSERKDMSCVKNGIAVLKLFVRCLVAMDQIRDLPESDEQQPRNAMLSREE